MRESLYLDVYLSLCVCVCVLCVHACLCVRLVGRAMRSDFFFVYLIFTIRKIEKTTEASRISAVHNNTKLGRYINTHTVECNTRMYGLGEGSC